MHRAHVTYADVKRGANLMQYQQAKLALFGTDGPFEGWIKIDEEFQRFTMDGHSPTSGVV